MPPSFTAHALRRMNQRHIPRWWVELAMQYGQRIYAQQTLFVFVGKRQVREMETHGYSDLDKLEGLTLVFDPKTRTLLTCFKNRRFTKKIRHKD